MTSEKTLVTCLVTFSTAAGPDGTGWVWQYSWAGQSQPPLEAVKRNHISRFRPSRDVKNPKSLCKYQQKVPKYLWWAWDCMLSLANLGRSHQEYDVYLTSDWVVRKDRDCFCSQIEDWDVSCLPCLPSTAQLSVQASVCEIYVTPTALAQDRGPGKPRSFQKATSSSRRGLLQGRR